MGTYMPHQKAKKKNHRLIDSKVPWEGICVSSEMLYLQFTQHLTSQEAATWVLLFFERAFLLPCLGPRGITKASTWKTSCLLISIGLFWSLQLYACSLRLWICFGFIPTETLGRMDPCWLISWRIIPGRMFQRLITMVSFWCPLLG